MIRLRSASFRLRDIAARFKTNDNSAAVSVCRSFRFRNWVPPEPGGLHAERHYTPAELAKLWGVDSETIRNLFRTEPDVMRIGERIPNHKRQYITMRIPESVAARVHRRLTACS